LPSYIFCRLSFITEDSVEGDITNPLSLNLYTYVENNPLIYIDPSGHVTEWDYQHITNSTDLQNVIDAGNAWSNATTQGRSELHDFAESIRDKYRADNEVGTADGSTVTINKGCNSSGEYLRPPDYASGSLGLGFRQYGAQVQVTEDTYGGLYVGIGRSWNQKGISLTGGTGYINQDSVPTPEQCIEFNSGQSVVVETSYLGGISETQCLTNKMSGTAVIFSWTPQVDETIYHSVYLGNPRKAIINLYNKIFK